MAMSLVWKKLLLDPRELRIDLVLKCGQSFRWRESAGIWSIGMKGRIILLQQDLTHLHYASIPDKEDTVDIIKDYFNLDVSLIKLYEQWSSSDAKFKADIQGIRILRQDPWENLVSFICSTNNNIKRITQMVSKVCTSYGKLVGEYDGVEYHEFPEPEKLSSPSVDAKLRALGFGYRAPYIQKTAVKVLEYEKGYLTSLRDVPYAECHEALLEFTGVGPKVADCVCLMSMDKHHVVPVDTHVWQIAQRDYKIGKKYSRMNKDAYKAIADHFVNIWGPYAGWAHSVMFTADLNLDLVQKLVEKLEPVSPKRKLDVAPLDDVKRIKVEA